jgi:Flp pilus assembly protein TadD
VTRREFLAATAALAAARSVPAQSAAEQPKHEAPYLALEKYIPPGLDEFPEEKLAFELRAALHQALHSGDLPTTDPALASAWRDFRASLGSIRRAAFHPLPNDTVRFEVSGSRDHQLYHRAGLWNLEWRDHKVTRLALIDDHAETAAEPWFRDVSASVFANVPSFHNQLLKGVPYWRARLDPASGIDVYGSNGIAVGDIDNDGSDEIYVCQPGGLPNRLYKIHPDGSASDLTEAWGVGLLDDTSAALFLDLRNIGRQDLIVLRSAGPVLYLNDGSRFRLRTDAFQFSTNPAGAFTGMAAADFDRDGKLDLYLCCYVYFQSEAQYTYAVPYHDARNGPPNFLFRNRLNPNGTGTFDDCTAETGMNENNDRFSFAPAWCDFNGDGWPDLYVANDFGRKNLYVNTNGHFRDLAAQAGVEDIGPGMSASWFDYDHDGRPDLYVANMWTDAGQRIVASKNFTPAQGEARQAYRGHTMGNTLFRNRGDGAFEDTTLAQHVEFGRWAWSSGGHDLDNDGHPEIFVTCGMLTNESASDLDSFFWRQVVARSPVQAQASEAYQNGWNAINQFLREDYSWNGHEPNVLHARRGNRYQDVSGISGLDFADDSRAFAVTDFDNDGRPDILLKSRLGPQLRVLQNNCAGSNHSIAFDLRGTQSNRDAIGARVEVDGQTKWLDAGSGFLSQHSKRLLFGLGPAESARHVRITWPSGLVQDFTNLQAGYTYALTEGFPAPSPAAAPGHATPGPPAAASGPPAAHTTPFASHRPLPHATLVPDNSLRLEDTWFLEPVPLPDPHPGPGLFLIKDPTPQYEIFRRYLFDWRAPLTVPLALLLNAQGHVIKIYAQPPTAAQVQADLLRHDPSNPASALPFPGSYIHPTHRDFFKFGGAYLWAGYPNQALPYLEKVLDRTPSNARVVVLIGEIHLQAARPGLAEKYFRDALRLDPHSPEASYGLGAILAKRGRYPEARALLEQAIQSRPDYADAINDLGAVFIQLGQPNDALAAFQYGTRVAPDEDILYLNLGRTYLKLGQPDKAREVMQRLLDRKPDSTIARRALQDLSARQ